MHSFRTLYIIQNNTLLVYNTSSGRLVGKFTTPGASPIANIAIIDKNKKNVDNVDGGVVERILIFTLLGELLEVEEGPGSSEEWTVIKTTELIWKSTSFPCAMNFTNFIWPTTTSSSGRFFYYLCQFRVSYVIMHCSWYFFSISKLFFHPWIFTRLFYTSKFILCAVIVFF